LSPISYAAQTLGVSLAAEKFGAQFFGDNAVPGGVISVEKHINETQAKETAKLWNTMFNNVSGKRRVAVIGDGGRFTPVSIRPDESQFLETQKATVNSVARIYGVPVEMIGGNSGDSLTYASVEQRTIDFLTYGINPWLVRLETALTELLPRGQVCKFNSGALLRSALKDRYESYQIGLANGFMTVEQIRELEDWPPLTEAQQPVARPALEAVAS
jgi:HK97 family phage portal protein